MSTLPPDDLGRNLTIATSDDGQQPHIGLAGATYTILLTGKDTAGRYCLIDMFIPPGGGPPLHRHDFEESFTVLEGEIEATFRGEQTTVRAGSSIQIPANAPHRFRNVAEQPARMLCFCAPAGQEEFFLDIGLPVAHRTAPAPTPDAKTQEALRAKSEDPKYRTEFLKDE